MGAQQKDSQEEKGPGRFDSTPKESSAVAALRAAMAKKEALASSRVGFLHDSQALQQMAVEPRVAAPPRVGAMGEGLPSQVRPPLIQVPRYMENSVAPPVRT